MTKIFYTLAAIILSINAWAQKKGGMPKPPSLPDVNAIMKMSPAELEAYKTKMIKQAGAEAAHYTAAGKASLAALEIKPPVKDIKRLTQIPSRPPTRAELVGGIQQSMQIIKQGIPSPKIEQVNTVVSSMPVEKIHQQAVLDFYSDDPQGGMLMMMQLAAKAPDSMLYINNLGAMYNLTGIMNKAIPLFEYCLQKHPQSATVLGNIGQSYLQLGDMMKAAAYFRQCLANDSLHLEANHSMGMIHYFKKEYDVAMKYFERELSVALRRSTLAMAYRMGRKFNLREIGKRIRRRSGAAEKDFMEEITLGKFSLPNYPQSAKEFEAGKNELAAFGASVQAEYIFWMNAGMQVGSSNLSKQGNQHPGLYHDLAQAMLEELGEEFTQEYLSNLDELDLNVMNDIVTSYTTELNKVVCTEAPAGSSLETQEAYAIKCCEEQQRPIADALLRTLGSRVQPLLKAGILRWKAYINQMIAIVQLDPSPANRQLACNATAGYFSYLSNAMVFYNAGNTSNFLVKCKENYNAQETDSLIQSNRLWNLECAPWMNVQIEFEGVAVKLDCNKFALEAGSSLMGAYEHEFKTHNSTLLLGPGMKGDLGGFIGGEVKTQLFLTFDGNMEFADIGLKRTLEVGISGTPVPLGGGVKIGGIAAGIEISDKVGINSGYNGGEVEWKGGAASYVEWLKQ
jgi:tetratricopeptide (TPR) repeat protein